MARNNLQIVNKSRSERYQTTEEQEVKSEFLKLTENFENIRQYDRESKTVKKHNTKRCHIIILFWWFIQTALIIVILFNNVLNYNNYFFISCLNKRVVIIWENIV
jgi:hypothetical protein